MLSDLKDTFAQIDAKAEELDRILNRPFKTTSIILDEAERMAREDLERRERENQNR